MSHPVADTVTGVEHTAFLTLHARAVDARSARPVLADERAAAIADAVDYDFGLIGSSARFERKERFNVAIRARSVDAWLASFTADNPDAVVIDLGCGLDTRVFRVDPPAGIAWYDLDLPHVIALRRELVPSRPGAQPIAASATADD